MKKEHTFFEKIRIFFYPVIKSKTFDEISGFITLINPIALVPQLYNCIIMDTINGVSTFMYIMFALLQTVFALIAIKAKNKLMFVSMFISVLISISIVILTIIKV